MTDGDRFGVRQVVQIADDVLAALDAMHASHRLLHRDVKPANVMLDGKRQRAYLGDFGSAARMDPATGTADAHVGSSLYRAPEAIPTCVVTVRSDLYALGVTILEMLNGRFPYEDLDRASIDARLVDGKRALTDRYYAPAPWVPKPLATFVRRLCNPDPNKRPPDAATALRMLRDLRLVDWRRTGGDGLIGTWQGYWPPESRRVDQRVQEVTTKMIEHGPNKGKIEATARWRNPNGKWRTYAKLRTRIDAQDTAMASFFRAVDAAAQSAPRR